MSDAIAVVVVTYNSAGELDDLAPALRGALDDQDEVVVVDNASTDATVERLGELGGGFRVLVQTENLGFARACRVGAGATSAPLLLFLNPDARLERDALELLRAVAVDRPGWAAWQPAVMLADGRVNSGGGVAHFLGFGWAGECGQPSSVLAESPYEAAFASGAALVVRRAAWDALEGFDDEYFLYGEDQDLGLRLWLSGRGVGVQPRARVSHGYEFAKGPHKWYLLERNRWRTLVADYPGGLLLALAPALLAAELGLLLIALRDGWLTVKLRADIAAVVGLPRALRRRRAVQRGRTISARAFAQRLTSSLDSPYIPELPRWLRATQAAYFALVLGVLRASQNAPC
ncbi:MAG: glycosyltransferase family 2 protein [Solirubrobacteraceae bacterium]